MGLPFLNTASCLFLLLFAGGDSARAVLSAVSKIGAPVTHMGEAKPKQQASTQDELRWDWSEAGIAL